MESRKFKIIFFSLAPRPIGYDGKSGSDVRLAEIFKRLFNYPEIEIVSIATEFQAECLKKNGVHAEFEIIKTNFKFSTLLGLCSKASLIVAKSFWKVRQELFESKDQKIIIYSSSDLFWEVIPAFVWKMRNKKIEWVQVVHHVYPDWKTRSGKKAVSFLGYYFQKFSFWLIRKKADKIIVMNSFTKIKLLEQGFDSEKMHVSSNGINFDYFDSLKKGAFSYDGVFLGRMNASKGVADLIPIWKKVCAEIPEAKLAIVGGSEKYAKMELAQKIKEQGLEKNIGVLGFLEDDEAFKILKAGKAFLFPSHEEGWGIVIAEALACGVPVVSWDLPVYQEIFEDYTTQIEENNFDLFAGNVVKLLKDEMKIKEVGDRGQEFIKKYSWEKVARKELEIIKS
jgi:glycosyltransferase involved in cell wall biosynthesis